MAHIPEGVQWFIAELVLEITVRGDVRNIVHKNLTLIRATSADDAYDRAFQLGIESEAQYENPTGNFVRIEFRGVSRLNVIYERLEDGAELIYEERVGVDENEIRKLIPPKGSLAVFRPITPSGGPDYSSKEIVDEAEKLLKGSKD